METLPAELASSKNEKNYVVILLVLALLILGAWLWNTPPGLLGKADAVGYAVCHRIAARSFWIGDRQTPLCARCSGMYLGALLGMVYLLARYQRRAGMPSLLPALVLILFVAAFAVDGSNSYLHFFPNAPGLYEPNNLLRMLTGTGVGMGIAAVLIPSLHQTLWRTVDARPALGGLGSLLPMIGLAALIDLALWSEIPLLLYPLALLSAVGVLMILTLAYTLIWAMIWKRENRASSWRGLLVPLLAGFCTALLQIMVIDAARYWFTGTWAGFNL